MIQDILSRINKVKKSGSGYTACCPAHEDNTPSLAVSEVNDRILIHCFAGCSSLDILSALGLTLKDLYPEGSIDHRLRGATPWIHQQRVENDRHATRHTTILRIAKEMRKNGERLTLNQMEEERIAWRALG